MIATCKPKLLTLLLLAACHMAFSQVTPTPPTGAGGMPPGGPPKTGPKPYKEVITDKAKTSKGLFTVHKVEDKWYFDISNAIINKDILVVNRFTKTPWGAGAYGGEEISENVIRWEKGPDNKLFLRTSLNIVSTPDSAKPIYEAIKNSSVDPIAASFDIKAWGKDSTSSIIEVTEFFKGDNQVVSLDAFTKRQFNLSMLASDRTYINAIKTFPTNTEIKTVKTYNSTPSAGFGPPSPGSTTLPAAFAAGAVTLEMNTSFIMLPEMPFRKRWFDSRVGYFADRYTEFKDESQKVENQIFITRWRLEPKDEDIEKYKRGELVVPKKQIVYYIDPATPKKWRQHLIDGINDWNIAFEKAGWLNAIVGKEWPENDSTMSLEDARYSVIRYFASDVQNAYGPNVHDPRTGEIMESHIGWYHNVMSLLHDWYFTQTAATDPGSRKMKFDDELMGDLIRFVSSHEVGHTLGLRHNMGSSSQTPVEKLRDKAWVEANGHTASIMDYARFNYVAQPEDNITRKGLYPRIGDYDKWAIEWGYRWVDETDADKDKIINNKWIVSSLAKNNRLWFGGEGFNADPRAQTEDLGDNNMKASEYGIKNLKRIVPNLMEWTKEEADKYTNLSQMYNAALSQYRRYIGHVTKNIGGVFETFKSFDEPGDVYAVTPKTTQKSAVDFLNKQLFETPTWLLDKAILNKIASPLSETITSIQDGYIGSILSQARLLRMISSANRDAVNAYTPDELITDLRTGIFSELTAKKTVDAYRRSVQKSMVEQLITLLGNNPSTGGITITVGGNAAPPVDIKKTDLPAIARGQLSGLRTALVAGLTVADKMTKYHYQDLIERIKSALEPK